MIQVPDQRPIIIAIAGPNGAGKTTFFHSHLGATGLRFVNTDVIASALKTDAMQAARIAAEIRKELVSRRESFAFETVLSDPVGEKVSQLRATAEVGYTVVLCFIGISSALVSEQRVCMGVSQGGHDVPPDRIVARFPRVMANLERAIASLPRVLVYDNDDLAHPYRQLAMFEDGRCVDKASRLPAWFKRIK